MTFLLFDLQTSNIYHITCPNTMNIHRLCTIILDFIYEMDCLDAPFSIVATTQLQPRSGCVQTKERRIC